MINSDRTADTDTKSEVANRKHKRDKFATTSLVIGILDFPFLGCGWLLAFTAVIAGAEGWGNPMVLLGLVLFLLTALPWIIGFGLGVVGLWSARPIAAMIGIVLSVLSPLVLYFVLRLLNPS